MVVAQGEVHHRANSDGVVALGVGEHQRSLGDSAHAHDGRVRLIDNGQPKHRAELPGVSDGER